MAAVSPSTRDRIEQVLPAYGYTPGAAALDCLAAYLDLVAAANARVRLVGSAERDTLVSRHLGESLFLGTLVPLARQTLVDVGSGAGFPGLALALAWPELKTTLVEATGKKAVFLRAATEELGVADRVQVVGEFLQRTPPAASGGSPLRGAEIITLRALEKMEDVPGWLGRWLGPGTQVAFWLGEARAEAWRREWPEWNWSPFHRLPGSRERGIVLGVPRPCST